MGCRQKKSAGLSKLHFTSPQEHFKEKNYHVFLELERFFFQILAKNLGQVCRNCFVRGQTSHSKETNGFRKANSLSFVFGFLVESFRDVGKKTSACLSKVHSILSQEKFKDTALNNFLFVFSDFRPEVLETVADYLRATLSELPCKCPVESFGERNVKKCFFFVFGWWAKHFWIFWQEEGSRLVKTAFFFSAGTFWGKKITFWVFLENERIFLQILSKSLR